MFPDKDSLPKPFPLGCLFMTHLYPHLPIVNLARRSPYHLALNLKASVKKPCRWCCCSLTCEVSKRRRRESQFSEDKPCRWTSSSNFSIWNRTEVLLIKEHVLRKSKEQKVTTRELQYSEKGVQSLSSFPILSISRFTQDPPQVSRQSRAWQRAQWYL